MWYSCCSLHESMAPALKFIYFILFFIKTTPFSSLYMDEEALSDQVLDISLADIMEGVRIQV